MDEITKQPEVNELADPYTAIINDMEVKQDDAAYMAGFVDTTVIVRALKKIKYNVKKKIEILGEILEDEESTVSETMRAMKALDDIMDKALSTQGIFVRPHPGNGNTSPIGLPVASVTMTEKSITMTREATSGLAEAVNDTQPLKETSHAKEEDDNTEDAYFEDNRGTNANVVRYADTECAEREE